MKSSANARNYKTVVALAARELCSCGMTSKIFRIFIEDGFSPFRRQYSHPNEKVLKARIFLLMVFQKGTIQKLCLMHNSVVVPQQ